MSLIIFIIGTVQGVRNFLDIVYPDPESPWVVEKYQIQVEDGKMTQEEAEKRAEESRQIELERNKIRNIKDFAQNIIMILISIPLFFVHWRRVSVQNE
jgi:hypothetical protein